MKKCNVIVFANEKEFEEHASGVCERLAGLPESKWFLGSWGEIQGNDQACIDAISSAVSHFLASGKEEIFFGCCEKDYESILAAIDTQACEVVRHSNWDSGFRCAGNGDKR